MLGYFVEDLIHKQQYDLGLSVVKRHDLLKNGCITKPDTLKIIEPYFQEGTEKTYKYIPNDLFEKDAFGPAEESLGHKEAGTYWNLKDFNMADKVIWVGVLGDETYNKACEDLLNSELIGIDGEFRFSKTKFEKSGVALLQIANRERIYLFDMMVLGTTPEYHQFMIKLFTDTKVLKVGHSLSGDLSMLRQDMDHGHLLFFRKHLDVVKAWKGAFPNSKQTGLGHICEQLLGKPISKFDQISNWNQRPLRKAQCHYAAMDAYVLIQVYDKLVAKLKEHGVAIDLYIDASIGDNKHRKVDKEDDEGDTSEEEAKTKSKKQMKADRKARHDEENKEGFKKVKKDRQVQPRKDPQLKTTDQYKHFYEGKKSIKFLIDNMLHKLALYMRNVGMDAEFLAEKDHKNLTELAKSEERVIITRDQRYFERAEDLPCLFI
jgi:hypothetical protein